MKKRIISLLMALLMLTSLLPTAVWAEGEAPEQAAAAATDSGAVEQEPAAETPEEPEQPAIPETPEASETPEAPVEPEQPAEPEDNGVALYSTASGQCGNNLTWTLNDGVLTISGTGAMWDWNNDWYGFGDVLSIDQADEVTSVVVKSGVTSIAYQAFNWLENMTSVTIPRTVTSIGYNAFMRDCDALATINYAGTTSQWKSYFGSTLSLPLATKVVCSNGTVTPALSGKCGTNVSYSISADGVLTISGNGAMNNFTYRDDESSDCPWHGVRYALKKIIVKEGVTSIGSYAFSFDLSVTDVTLPNSLKTIGRNAFWGCYGLTSVVIPEGVTSVGAYAFALCSAIKTITVPASATELGNRAFVTWEYYGDDDYYMELTDIYYGGSQQQWYDAGGGDAALLVVTVHFNSATGNIIDSGTCGDNAFWKLDKDYTLTIYGTGAMYDYYPDDNGYLTSPWINFDVKKIDVQEGITSIGAYALCRLKTATEVSLPRTLTTIGRNALYNIGVSSFVIPDNVVSIGDFAFNGCDNLKTITLPAGLQKIGHCFIECDALETINFKGTMDQWLACGGGWSIFPAQTQVVCASGTMNLSGTCGDNLIWRLDNSGKLTVSGTGAMYDYDYDYENDAPPVVPWAKYRSMIRSVEIGSGVTYIGAWAFEDTNITSLTIPGNVKSLGAGSFSDNRYLVNLTFNSGLKRIESMAFAGSHLSTVVIPDGVTSIGERAFSNCVRGDVVNGEWVPSGLTAITIPASVISIGKDMLKTYDEYDLLATVNFGGTQEQWNAIGGKDAGVPDSATINYGGASIPNGTCGDNAFWVLSGSTLTIGGSGAMYDYPTGVGDNWQTDWALPWKNYAETISRIVVGEGITSIGTYAFCWLENATEVSLPSTLTTIGEGAFWNIAAASLVIPDNVVSIGGFAFNGCNNLTTITLPAGLQEIGPCFIDSSNLNTINFKGTMEQWLACGGGESTFPAQTQVVCASGTLSRNGKCGDNLTWRLDNSGTLTIFGNGEMDDYYYDDTPTVPWAKYRSMIRSVVIGSGVTYIGAWAFEDTNITSLTIPGSVKTIGDGSFFLNRYLAKLTLNSGLETICPYAFSYCRIGSVDIPDGVTSIGEEAFSYCVRSDYRNGNWVHSWLSSITIPASVTSIGKDMLKTYDDYDLPTTVNFNGTQEQWNAIGGKDAGVPDTAKLNFATVAASGKCGDDLTWTLDNGVLTISGKGAMTNYQNYTAPWVHERVTRVIVGEGVTSIGSYAFDCIDGTEISLPSTLTTIGQNAFSGIDAVSLVIPDNVVRIDNFAFNACWNLQTITLPAGLQEIGACFIECHALKTINFKGTMEQWLACGGGQSTFPVTASVVCQGGGTMNLSGTCGNNLTWTLDNDGKLTISGTGAMYNRSPWAQYCSMIRSIEIGSGVTSIGAAAFMDTNITSLTIPGSVKSIGNHGVRDNRFLSTLTLNSGLETIGAAAFEYCRIGSVVIPDGVTSIGSSAFAYCVRGDRVNGEWTDVGLTTVTIPGSVTSIGKDTFTGCILLTTVNFGSTQARWNAIGGKNAGVPDTAKLNYSTAVASGKCGENVTYTLSDDGILTISGKGAVTQIPWQNSTVKEVIVLDGVTSLCGYAFTWQPVTRVTLPDSLTSIGVVAFAGCQIEELYLPRNLKNVGGEAFSTCTKLTYLDMDKNCAAKLDDMAFANCSALKTIHLSANITLGKNVFVECGKLEKVIFEGSGKQWLDLRAGIDEEIALECRGGGFGSGKCGENLTWELDSNGLLTISGSGRMYDYQDTQDSTPEGQNSPWTVAADGTFLFWYVHEIRIDYGVTHIGDTAFKYCHYVDEITVPSSVTSIGESAFRFCKNLRSVTIPDTVTSIGENAFFLDGNLSIIYFSGSKEQWNNLNPSSLGLSEGFTAAGGYANVTFIKPGVIVTGGDAPQINDVASLYDHLVGQAETEYTQRQELAADVNRDGTLDVYDLQLLYEAVTQGQEL